MLRKVALFTVLVTLAALTHGQSSKRPTPLVPPPPAPGSGESLVRVLRTSNKAQTNHYVCDTLTFNNVNPFNIINYFWAVTSREEGGIYSFVNPDGNSGKVVIICPEYQLESLRKLARELDRPKLTSAPGSKYIYYRMRHRNILDPSFRASLAYYTGTSGLLIPDGETNSVLIYDAPEGANACEKALDEELDHPLQQVEIGVNVYEVDVNNDGTLGLDFEAWKNGPGKLLGQYRSASVFFNTGGGNSHFHTSANGYYLDYPSAYFDFLVEKGKAKSLVRTKVTAINRVPALLTTGEQIPYYEVQTNDATNDRELHGKTAPSVTDPLVFPSNGRVFTNGNLRSPCRSVGVDSSFPLGQAPQNGRPIAAVIKTVDTGVALGVVPIIGKEMVTMDLNLKVINNTGFDGSGHPLLSSRQMTDSVAVALGDEVIFGGLTRERKVQNARKVPFFGSLPVIGYLFGDEITTARKSVVVTSVNPRVVLGNNNVTEADRSIKKKVNGEEVVVLPETEFCFEQSAPTVY